MSKVGKLSIGRQSKLKSELSLLRLNLFSDFNSKFNSELNSLVKLNDAPLIYEKLGSRFSNFFIDEFQDTSELQWENLIPLISNSIQSESHDGTKGSLLIVGDPKQSIYRWRGSRINQFVNLILGETNPFYINPEIEKIDTNYRSLKNIVDFNSEFFSILIPTWPYDSTSSTKFGNEL